MSNVSTGALELSFLSGSTPSILPTMLGGSAPSQTSGAPYRTESESRAAGWPSPAHQNDVCNRGYGVYSLFPGPGDAPRTLYTPAAKSSSSGFQDFVGPPKVPEGLFSKKFAFVSSNGTPPQFDSPPRLGLEQKAPQRESAPKSFAQVPKPYSPTGKKAEEPSFCAGKESKPKRLLSNEVVIIKTEVEEGTRGPGENGTGTERQDVTDVARNSKERKNAMAQSEREPVCARVGDALASEPDSTEFKILNETSEDVTTSEVETLEKEAASIGVEASPCLGKPLDRPGSNELIENCNDSEKCNIKVIDSVGETDSKKQKKTEKFPVKVESVNEICSRLSEKKYVKAKTPDSNFKNSLVPPSKKHYNEPSKPSPTRTLSLSPQNGGCSRTTPVTFKHASQQETDPKPQNIHIEVPPLFIKKEPSDFLKNNNGTPFLSPAHLDNNFFSPGGLNVLDGQLLSPMPYSGGFESSNRQKDTFLSPLDQSFLSPGQAFLSPRPVSESPFLSPAMDFARFAPYKNYPSLPKVGGNYLLNGNEEKISERVFLKSPECLPPKEDRQGEDGRGFINSTTAETGSRGARMSENIACAGSNLTPCQVAEVTSASSLLSPKHSNVNPLVVKQEMTSVASSSGSSVAATSIDQNKETAFMTSGQSTIVSSTVGVSSTRQRCQQRVNEIKMASNSGPSPPIMHRSVKSPASIDLPPSMGAAVFAGGMMDDRSANLITTWPAQTHNPTLWQYSAPIDYPPFPPVGFQLVRDPITGHFLLIPASNLEALQRAILWPSYQSTPPQMIIPPLSVQPSTPHLLLDTNVPAVDFLTSETIHHTTPQHRILISSDNSSKRKINTPTLIKLEASDCSNPVVVTACDNNNIYAKAQPPTLSPRREPVFHSQRSLSSVETGRRSQATSPCLTPVLENLSNQSDSRDSDSLQRTTTVTLQDASNQTDLPFETETEGCMSSMCTSKDKFIPYTKTTEGNVKTRKTQDAATETVRIREPEDDKSTVIREIRNKKEAEETLNISCAHVPDELNIKKEIISPSQVDLSGLELLSNSIEQFVCDIKCKNADARNGTSVKTDEDRKDLSNDACEGAVLLQNLRNGFREVEESKAFDGETPKNLGGLGLLCALAEQRFQEEIGKDTMDKENIDLDNEDDDSTKEENRKILISDLDCLREKDPNECDLDSNQQNDSDELPKLKKEVETVNDENRTPAVNKALWQEEYKKEGDDPGRRGPEKGILKRKPGRPKKFKNVRKDNSVFKSFFSGKTNRNSKEMSPPVLEKETDFSFSEKSDLQDSVMTNSKEDILKPPTLTPSTILDPVIKTMAGTLELSPCEVNLIALKFSSEKLKKPEGANGNESEVKKRKISDGGDSYSSSKKRKVGRPKKHHLLHQNSLTETIVAKKPKTKPYLLQPVQTVENGDCSKTKSEDSASEKIEKKKNAFVKLETDPVVDAVSESPEDEEKKSKKIRPKLKAEPKVKEWAIGADEESLERKKITKKEDPGKQKVKITKKVVAIEGDKFSESSGMNGTKEPALPSCLLTTEHLKSDKFPIRTLTAMGGLFYAGQLSAIRAPDVYGITIDGERGNRPHIYSREEILKDSILEVKTEKTSDLPPGTRCCAYWSEQYRCLYPGTVSAPVSPDPELDDKFVNVEFDDGDSGKINIDDIRLLPEDYPIVEYDPNPLQSLSKRKRRISGASVESHSKERKSIDSLPSPEKSENINGKLSPKLETANEETEPKKLVHAFEPGSFLSLESERRHLKKKRREKLKRLQSLSIEGKKKHKKHKCSDEHRHHRHHKKHRKHKHKHGKRHTGEMNGDAKRGGESSESSIKEKEEATVKKKVKAKCKSVENSCKLSDKSRAIKPKKCKKRTESVESRSKMAAFLPARQLWGWSGKGFRRPGAKGRARKEFYKTIQRGKERITVGDCAVFLSTGRPDRPYIGRIESMWESWGTNMIVRVKWFYHPEETVGCPATLEYPGALFESPHVDENDVQTISHKCEVLPLKEYTAKIGNDPHRYETIYDNNDIYYLAGYYDPTNTTLKMEPGVK